ncbi:8344_t:CDS:2 [Funneliformis geosporum]|uniref:5038_t:CDS:1 n=1 Tax=Funneliformis geosporum TaxID=1117311 RepID=A0A9W4WTM4_9GLOM|nr:5038_t:CDS:2 [Funneliformis geosporum]CAI2188173.1 8344_t:CDS:2 [Funneliformis geosporum]
MKLNPKSFASLVSILLYIAESTFAAAVPKKAFTSLIVFGDSYTDNGNGTFVITNGTVPPSPPYFEGRFCNGPVWVEYLAGELGIPLIDKAFGGATSDSNLVRSASGPDATFDVPGVIQQIDAYIQELREKGVEKFDENALFSVVLAGNDYSYSLDQGQVVAPEKVVERIMLNLQTLFEFGAANIIVNTMPNFSNSPLYAQSNVSEAITNIVETHNQLLKSSLDEFVKSTKANIFIYKADELFTEFTTTNFHDEINVSKSFNEQCITYVAQNRPQPCDQPDQYIFWDRVHVTTKIHKVIAENVLELLG